MNTFTRDGFVYLPAQFPAMDILVFEAAVSVLTRKLLAENNLPAGPSALLNMSRLQREAPQAFYRLCSDAGGMLAGLTLLSSLRGVLANIFGQRAKTLLLTPPTLFWNEAGVPRLHYDWHQESSYFAGQPSGCHVWFPLFNDVALEDGPMLMAQGSHVKALPYRHVKREGSLTQLIPDADVEKTFSIVPAIARRGDAWVFHHNTIHRTGENRTKVPRVAGIVRVIDPLVTKFQPLMGYVFKEEVSSDVAKGAVA